MFLPYSRHYCTHAFCRAISAPATPTAGALPANSCTQPSPATPVRSTEATSSGPLSVDQQFEQLLQQSQPEVHQQGHGMGQSRQGPSQAFRFRAPDFTAEDSEVQMFASPQQASRAQQQVQFLTPPPASKAPWQPHNDAQPGQGGLAAQELKYSHHWHLINCRQTMTD